MKYIDADKLIAKIKRLQHEQGFDTGEAESAYQIAIKDIFDIVNSLQQEQTEVDLEKEIEKKWNECDFIDEGMGAEYVNIVMEQFDEMCKYFYELGQCEMRNRITNPEYNKQVVERMESEHPIAANEEELKKAIKERYPMPEDADAHTRDRIAAARNGFLSGYSYELGRKGGKR